MIFHPFAHPPEHKKTPRALHDHKHPDYHDARHQRKLARHQHQQSKLKKATAGAVIAQNSLQPGGWSKNRRRSYALDHFDQKRERMVKIVDRKYENLQKLRNLFVASAIEDGGVHNLYHAMDVNNSGGVTLKEFRVYLAKQGWTYVLDGVDLSEIFNQLDEDHNGLIEKEELAHFIGKLHRKKETPKVCTTKYLTEHEPGYEDLELRRKNWEEHRKQEILTSPTKGTNPLKQAKAKAFKQLQMLEQLEQLVQTQPQLRPSPIKARRKSWVDMSPAERHAQKVARYPHMQVSSMPQMSRRGSSRGTQPPDSQRMSSRQPLSTRRRPDPLNTHC